MGFALASPRRRLPAAVCGRVGCCRCTGNAGILQASLGAENWNVLSENSGPIFQSEMSAANVGWAGASL